jgi:hypothetical protein
MPRLLLSDEHWSKLREILLHKAIYNKRDLRMTVEGMLYRMRTGCPWRDLPKAEKVAVTGLGGLPECGRAQATPNNPVRLCRGLEAINRAIQ